MKSRKSKIKRNRKIIFNRNLITSEKFIKNETFNFTLLNNVNYIKNLFNDEENTRDNFHNYKEVYKDIIKNIIKLRIKYGNNFYLELYSYDNDEICILPRIKKEYQKRVYVGKFIKHRLHKIEKFYECDYLDVFETGLYN